MISIFLSNNAVSLPAHMSRKGDTAGTETLYAFAFEVGLLLPELIL